MNFVGDGEVSHAAANKIVQTGKIAVGQERSLILDREQLIKWGAIKGA